MTDSAEKWAEQWATEIMPRAVEAHDRLTIAKGSKPSPFFGTGGSPGRRRWTTPIRIGREGRRRTTQEGRLPARGDAGQDFPEYALERRPRRRYFAATTMIST